MPAYQIQVFSSPAGPAAGELKLDPEAAEIKAELAVVRGIQTDLDRRRDFGQRLFDALFNGDILAAWNDSWGRVTASNSGLRLRLWIDIPELALLPWELLHDPARGGFLATAANTVLSRYLPVREPPLLQKQQKLRILVVIESPAGLPAIEEDEIEKLRKALDGLGAGVEYDVLKNVTAAQINQALQRDYNVLHYLGHGTSRQLVLAAADGSAEPIDDEQFAQLVQGRSSLRLIFLNACHSGQADDGGLFGGVGPNLVSQSIPAVIAMQYPTVQLSTASDFSAAVYGALANGLPVDVAVNEGRKQLSAGPLLGTRDWSTPVLYMGTRSGRILHSPAEERQEVESAWKDVQEAARAGGAVAALAELAKRFEEVSSRVAELKALAELAQGLARLRGDFSQCVALVEQAQGVVPLAQLQNAWRAVSQQSFSELQVIVEREQQTVAAGGDWYAGLDSSARKLEDDLRDMVMGALANDVFNFRGSVALAETRVAQQAKHALDSLISYSDRTLGVLAVK